MSDRDARDRMGLDPDKEPTPEQLHSAYRQQAREVHPDVGGDRGAWDALQEAYAMLVANGEHIASDQQNPDHWYSKMVWGWRGWTRPSRVGVVLVVGFLLELLLWDAVTIPYVPLKTSVGIVGYAAGWWVWWIVRESRRRPVKPMTWAIVPNPPFFEIRIVDSPGMVK